MIVERAYRQRWSFARSVCSSSCSIHEPTLFESHRPAVIVEYLPKSHAVFLQRIFTFTPRPHNLGSRAEAKDGTSLPVAHT